MFRQVSQDILSGRRKKKNAGEGWRFGPRGSPIAGPLKRPDAARGVSALGKAPISGFASWDGFDFHPRRNRKTPTILRGFPRSTG